uniref:Uncharacterized protein n=1 Tax=Rhizophora mucronata TaxID=61149 RepID=A0A2P2NNK1_RHIMU
MSSVSSLIICVITCFKTCFSHVIKFYWITYSVLL